MQDMCSYSVATVNTYVHVQSMACLSFCNLCEQAHKHILCTACDTGALLEPTKIQELATAWNWLTFRTLDPAWMLPNKMTNLLCVLILYDVTLRFLPFFLRPKMNHQHPTYATHPGWRETKQRPFAFSPAEDIPEALQLKVMTPIRTWIQDIWPWPWIVSCLGFFSEYIYTYIVFISTHIYIYCTYDYLRVYGVPVLDIAHVPGKGNISFLRVYVSLRSQPIFMI